MAATLRELGFPYVALVPGASYAALHDSIVNFLGNHDPKILLCLHEEHAAFMGSGYAQVTGDPLLIIVHTNVGLMHASMGIFDTWCGRQPMVVIGTTAFNSENRTPWIEWIHTSADQAGMVRGFVKWDDEPHSLGAAINSFRRATLLARAEPPGPTLVTIDRGLQEQKLDRMAREGQGRALPAAAPGRAGGGRCGARARAHRRRAPAGPARRPCVAFGSGLGRAHSLCRDARRAGLHLCR